jgi:signal transduction histidine kinase
MVETSDRARTGNGVTGVARRRFRDRLAVVRLVFVLIAMWLLGLSALGVVFVLGHRVDDRSRAQVVVADLRKEMSDLSPLAFSSNQGLTRAQVQAQLDAGEHRIALDAARLGRLAGNGGDPAMLIAEAQHMYAILARANTLASSGHVNAAGILMGKAGNRGAPEARLGEIFGLLSHKYDREVVRTRFFAEAGSFAAIFVILLAFSLAFVRASALARKLAAQNEQLRELDVMKDEFVALVSHELRTPLTAIQGYTELVLDGTAGELNEEQRTMLGAVSRNSGRLFRLINDLLFVAEVNAGKLNVAIEDVDLGAVAAEAIDDARPRAATAEVTLVFESEPELMVRADRVRLGQVFDNLISNAIKFTAAGGRVGLSVSLAGEDVVIVVADSGMGMTNEDQQRLFTRFFRTKAAVKIQGTGLGLSITKAILDAHHGSIRVESQIGEGTRFIVTVPTSDQTPLPAAA